jgi:DivIVA domain-containing protein
MPLTPADVRNKQFSTTRLRPGYDEEEVDAFLDEVESELDRLIQENEELRAKLAECLRGKVPALTSPVSEPKQEMLAPPEPQRQELPPRPEMEPKQPEPAMMGMQGMQGMQQPGAPGEDNMDTAARVLALAQQTADQAVADARREADETLGRARREADEILGKARRQAEQITSDARARAESLERDAQERHRKAMGSLVQQREELERRVDDLRGFEREYRSRLKAYFEDQLRDLEAGAQGDTGAFGAIGTPSRQPVGAGLQHSDLRNGQQGGPGGSSFPTPAEAGFRPGDGPHDRR